MVHPGSNPSPAGPLPRGHVLGEDFFARPSDVVARELVGKILWSFSHGGGRLTEVEAYLPQGDPASHAACGPTRRNGAMFGPPGTVYVFLSYGVHHLLNLVCDSVSVGSAVLVRSFEPLADGHDERVGRIACGPGRVGKALDIRPSLDGLRLGEESGLVVMDDGRRPEVGVTTRVGITRGDWLLLRYYMVGSCHVSRRAAKTGGSDP